VTEILENREENRTYDIRSLSEWKGNCEGKAEKSGKDGENLHRSTQKSKLELRSECGLGSFGS